MNTSRFRARAGATMRNMMRSLRIRLLLLLGVAIGAAAFLQFTASFRAAMQEANNLFDYHMQQMAFALQDSGFEEAGWHGMAGANDEDFEFVVQIWTDDGVRVYQSRTYRVLPERAPLGYSNVRLPNGDWRVYAVQASTRVIQVAQRIESRRSRAMALALRALWPVLAVSVLLFGAAWWVVTSALAPLNRIGHDLANRNADSLAPVSTRGVPHEVSLLVAELNSLLARVAKALQSQQRFVADAAHELRSPLTALRLQVQTLARARDDAARQQAVARLLGGVDRATRLVEQLLVLARQDPAVPE
ncbi:MAG TPA: histidine kinase dimerization/phospho-acceptor domain-containing protein, partial [Noviherbaspirillum sp.]|nr:histidine kinase dimerization/phospho-acceptor domain-containing protein [Noviherbaspirillum sp.]